MNKNALIPSLGWINENSYGMAIGTPSTSSCGCLFKNLDNEHMRSFSRYTCNGNALRSKLMGAMFLVEIAYKNNYSPSLLTIKCTSWYITNVGKGMHM